MLRSTRPWPSRSTQSVRAGRGMVTAELAVGLLVAAMMAAVASWAVSLVVTQTSCADVAAQVARQLARGDQTAADQAGRRAPRGSQLSVVRSAATVTVSVTVAARWGRWGPVRLSGRATADIEPGVNR